MRIPGHFELQFGKNAPSEIRICVFVLFFNIYFNEGEKPPYVGLALLFANQKNEIQTPQLCGGVSSL